MTDMDTITAPAEQGGADEFAERLFGAVLGAQEVQAVWLGRRLGWYQALAAGGPLTSTELAARTRSQERYAREWLEHQAVCGYVEVDDVSASPTDRRFSLPPAHAEVLTDEVSEAYVAPLAEFVATMGRHLGKVETAYRTGGGVSWAEFGDDARDAQAAANRPLFVGPLARDLFPQVPAVHDRLARGGRVADIGCGAGWSSIGIATWYPDATVDGFDVDAPSIDLARRYASDATVDDRVRFHATDGADAAGDYDVVVAFECIHDMPDPVSVLAGMRRLAGDDGVVVVMDENVGETFHAPGDEVERLMYGYSITCCLPDGLSHEHSVGTGTVMRPSTLESYALDAGFASVEVLPLENDFFRFYLLRD